MKKRSARPRDLVPAEWFWSKILIKFAAHNTRTYRGSLADCIHAALTQRPELQFKRYQLYKNGMELPGMFAVAGKVMLIEERDLPNNHEKVCFYSCDESISLGG